MTLDVGGRDLFIYSTHNGGATWSISPAFVHQGKNTDFVSMNDGITWDSTGMFHITHNAGTSWSNVTPNINFGDDMPDMDFVSTTTGWLIQNQVNGSTPLYRTLDGGATWTLLSPNQPAPTPVAGTLTVQAIDVQVLDYQPVKVNAIVRGTLPDSNCTTISSVNQVRDGNTFRITLTTTTSPGQCNNTPTYFDRVITLDTTNLPPAQYIVNANGFEKSFELVTQDLTKFGQTLVDALNARNFDTVKVMMDQSLIFAFWQSQGTSYTPDQAVEQLQTNYLGTTPLTADANKDLNALLNGTDPYSVVGLDPNKSQALFVSGWGLDGKDEAILYSTKLADGSLYWHSVLIAKGGFTPDSGSISHEAFCADTRIPALIEQLKTSMNQSNGDMFSALVSPAHGVDVRLWAYASPVNFNTTSAKNVFTDTTVYNWGGGPSGIPDMGTFKDLIQPKLLDVLNAPNMETYCDNLTKVYPLSNPWPYPNIRYYNLYKPSTTASDLDFRTWLIGFEYINNQPYLYGMVTIVWEP